VQEPLNKPSVVEGTYGAMMLTLDMQRKILALICRRPDFLPRFASIVKPAYFYPSEIRVDICRLCIEYFNKYKTGPTPDAVAQMITTMVVNDSEKFKIHQAYFDELNLLVSYSLIEEQFITDTAITFATSYELYMAGTKLRDVLMKGDLAGCRKVLPMFQEASRIGQDKKDIGSRFADGAWIDTPPRHGILPTMLPTLDGYLCGGLARGEMGVIAAPMKRFKSGALINIAIAAMMYAGYTVVHLTMELTIPEVEDRYARALLRKFRGVHTADDMRQGLNDLLAKHKVDLITKHWSIGTAKPEQIKDYLRNLVSIGAIVPSEGKLLIICDYPGCMYEDRGKGQNRSTNIQDNYRAMIQIAQEFNCPVWCAAQMNNDGFRKEVTDQQDLAWCKAIAADAHVILTLCQTKDEFERKELRIYTAVVRAGKMYQIVKMMCDPETTWTWFEA